MWSTEPRGLESAGGRAQEGSTQDGRTLLFESQNVSTLCSAVSKLKALEPRTTGQTRRYGRVFLNTRYLPTGEPSANAIGLVRKGYNYGPIWHVWTIQSKT